MLEDPSLITRDNLALHDKSDQEGRDVRQREATLYGDILTLLCGLSFLIFLSKISDVGKTSASSNT